MDVVEFIAIAERHLCDLSMGAVVRVVQKQRQDLKSPPETGEEMLETLLPAGSPRRCQSCVSFWHPSEDNPYRNARLASQHT